MNISKTIEIYRTKNSQFPTISESFNLSYSGTTLWQQGHFGTDAIIDTRSMGQVPVDPLTKTPYAYAVSQATQEFQVGTILERNRSTSLNPALVPQNYAEETSAYFSDFMMKGSYNGKFLSYTQPLENGDIEIFVLGVPSLITNVQEDTELRTLHTENRFVYPGSQAAPALYRSTLQNKNDWVSNTQEVVEGKPEIIYQGTNKDLSGINEKMIFVRQLQDYYEGTQVAASKDFELIEKFNPSIDIYDVNEIVAAIIDTGMGGLDAKSLEIEKSYIERNIDSYYRRVAEEASYTQNADTTQKPFVTIWKTDVQGMDDDTDNTTITLPYSRI